MMIFLTCVIGCANTRGIEYDSFCLWANPISLTRTEINTMTEYSLRQIDNYNLIYDRKCGKEKK
jgi:hypothetical protein